MSVLGWQGVAYIIGVSLSEPHTSVTALRTRMSIYLAMAEMSTFKYFTKIELKHVKSSEGLTKDTYLLRGLETPGKVMRLSLLR